MYRVNSWMKSDFGFGILMHLMDRRFAKLKTCSKVICCDSSDTGYGFREMCDGNVQSVGLWDERDRKKNCAFRELKATLFALKSFCSHLRNEKVKVFSNSQNAVGIIHVGSPVTELLSIAVTICMEAPWIS